MAASTVSAVEWHGDKAFNTCADCGKLVQINKSIFGSLHLCISDCEKAGRHLDIQTRRRGPFWARRTETYCARCGD